MHEEKEPKKLTRSSRKSYDGRGTHMAEEKFEESADSHSEEEETKEKEHEEHRKQEASLRQASLLSSLREVVASVNDRDEADISPEDARRNKLEEFFKERLEEGSEEDRDTLKKDLKALSRNTGEDTELKEFVEESETVLEKVLEEVEENHNTTEDLDAQERSVDKAFAEMIVRVFDEKAEAARKPEPPAEHTTLTEQEETEAKLLFDILLSSNDTKGNKTMLTAALLNEAEFAGNKNSAKREKIFQLAKQAGLEREDIIAAQAVVAAESIIADPNEQVSESESVESLTAFEELVVKQIETASAEEVRTIKGTWEKLLATAPQGSEMASQAQEAIEVLGNIIQLKDMQAAGHVDKSKLALPLNMGKEDLEADNLDKNRDEKDKKLAGLLNQLFRAVHASNTKEDQAVVSVITDLLLASGDTQEEKQRLLNSIAAFFPMNGNRAEQLEVSGLHGYLAAYALSVGLVPPQEEGAETIQGRNSSFEKLIEKSLKKVTDEDLKTMNLYWASLLENEDLQPVARMQIEEIKAMSDSLVGESEMRFKDESTRRIEKPETLEEHEIISLSGEKSNEGAEKIGAFLDEVQDINGLESFEDLTVDRLQKYTMEAQEVLTMQDALSETQMMSAYIALMTQVTVLRNELERKGDVWQAEFRETQKETMPIMAKLLGKLREVNAQGYGQNMEQISTILKERERMYREYSGFTMSVKVKNDATPAPVKATDQYGRETGEIDYITDAVVDVQTAPADRLIGRGLDPQVEQVLRRGDLRRREYYADEGRMAVIENEIRRLQDQLNYEIQEQFRNNTTERLPRLEANAQARALIKALAEQRENLRNFRSYTGVHESREEMDPEIHEGYVHEVLGERMQRIKTELEIREGRRSEYYTDANGNSVRYTRRDNEELLSYYNELQRWTRILLKNDIRNNPKDAQNPNALKLSNERYARYKRIAVRQVIKEIDINAMNDDILNDISYMEDRSQGNFLRFFMQNVHHPEGPSLIRKSDPRYDPDEERHYDDDYPDPFNPENLLGVPYKRPKEMGQYAPESLADTMDQIAKEFSNENNNFHTGGNRELINAEGEFMLHNFYYWIRLKINEDVDYNKDGSINPFQKVIIKLPMGNISMYELLLLIPEYTAQRNFEIKANNGNENEVYSGWGDKTEHPEFGWEDLNLIAAEMEFRGMTHEIRTKFTPTSVSNNKEQYLNLMKQLHHNNHWSRASNVFLMLGLPSSNVNGKQEILNWAKKEKQGSLGKAMSDMLVAYNYLSEITDYYKITGTDKVKNFNENMFYRFLEPDGANRFLIKMAEGALNYNNDAKRAYAQFIKQRIDVAAMEYLRDNPSLSQEKRTLLEQFRNEGKEGVPDENDIKFEINFTTNEKLKNFRKLVESRVLGKDVNDEELDLTVRNELVHNLKAEYFDKLKNMQVMSVTKKKSTNRYLMTDSSNIRFGDIKLESGGTMDDLLDSFDVDQILKFDFSNNPNDPTFEDNPFKDHLNSDPRLLRRKIDEFMDPRKNPRNHKLFKRNEQMMLEFTRHITRIDRPDLNHFRDAEELVESRDMIRRAFQYTMEKEYGIDSVESEYAWWWVRDYVYLWGIGASLDAGGIGFRWDGKIMGTGKWRPRRQGKDGGGNPHTFDEFRALTLPFLHHMQVTNISNNKEKYGKDEPYGHRSVFSWLQGGRGGEITPRAVREFDKISNYKFQQHAEALYVDNNLENASEFIDLLAKTEFDVTGIVSFDVLGNVVFDYAKARDVFGKWRKAARYTYGKNFLDYREKIWVDGQEKTLYEHFLGPKTRALNELIKRQTGRSIEKMYQDPADAVMMSIVAAEVAEHRSAFGSGHHWTIQNVLELERFLLDFMTEYKQTTDEDGETHSEPDPGKLFNHKIFAGALKAYHTAYHKMYSIELGSSIVSGILYGFWAGLKESLKRKWVY